MHIVILTQVLDRQDAVLGFFHRWCEVIAGHVDRLTVVAQRVGDVQLPANVDVVSLGKERGAGLVGMEARLIACLSGLTGARRPDAVLAHMVPKFVLYAWPVTTLRRIPVYLWYTHKGVDWALRAAVPRVRKVFTASEESFRLESGFGKRVVTGHGIDCRHFSPTDAAAEVDVLSVGRLAPSKGHHEVLDAVAALPGERSVEIAGEVLLDQDRAYREQLEARVAAMPAARLLGAVSYPEINAVMRRSRVLVNASRTGSVDKVVLEAMACGTPCLTCNESFERVLGTALAERLMFPMGDVAALGAKLAGLLAASEDERRALGAELRARVQAEHDLEALAPKLVDAMRPAS